MSKNNDSLLIGLAIIGFALVYSRKQQTAVSTQGAAASMPGSVGTGYSQVIGGALGALLRSVAGQSVSQTPAPYYSSVSVPLQDAVTQSVDLNAPGVDIFGGSVMFIDP